jgi:glycosyltransferase involved in cell wall biosynthesis
MPRARILEQVAKHDFFVLLSDFEGLPLALVEAMARGCVPVVAATESGIPELVDAGANGLIVGGRDYDEWACQLVDLWRDRARFGRMSCSARATVRERFTVEQVAKEFDRLFQRVADEIDSGGYERPPSLHWGEQRAVAGDVLPPPFMYRPVNLPGLR